MKREQTYIEGSNFYHSKGRVGRHFGSYWWQNVRGRGAAPSSLCAMRILDRYIFREILYPFLIALVALTFVAFLAFSREIGWLLELIVRQSATFRDIWAISIAYIPNVLTFTIPMAVLVGILTGFGRMSSDSEAIAFRATGISMVRLLAPVLSLGILAFVANLAMTVWIAPQTAARLRDVRYEFLARQVSLEVKPRVFNESLTNFVLYVQNIAREGFNWQGILWADMSQPDEIRVTFARSGAVTKDEEHRTFALTLTDGSTHVVSPRSPHRYSYDTFDTTTLSVPMPQAPTKQDKIVISEMPTAALWNAMKAGTATYEERVEFHRRFALPFACLIFTLAGLPLGVSTTRGSKSMGLVLSLILMLLYYLVFVGGTRIASNAQFSPFLGAWLPNLAFAALGTLLIARSNREHDNRLLNSLASIMRWFSEKRAEARTTRKRLRQWTYSLTHHPKFFRLLDAYVLRGFWFFFTLVLVAFVALFILVTLFELLPDIVKNKVESATVITYFVYLLPQILYYVIPLTVLLAILIDLGTLTKTNEILAVKAGAVSLYRMAMPLLLMGLLLSAGIYFLQDFMLPYANQLQDEYHDIIKGRAPQTYRDPQRKWMAGSGERIYHYNYFDPDQDVFGGISIFGFKPNSFELTEWMFATRATWDGAMWKFEDGWTRRIGTGGSVDYQPFTSLEVRELDRPDYFKKEVRTAAQMTYPELKRYVTSLKQSGFDVSGLMVDLYRKLSFPLVSFIMAIIGIPFSFTTGKKGAFYGIGLCLAVGIFYWSMFEFFDKLGGINRLSPFVAAWFPNLIFGFGGIWMMLRVKT
ncbi:MAG: LPS export ABC transporter permease LptF [Acidobacteria bacterium]|nr:MAG: LPS export ABC transporter permease LptF [Acidobacteriota bacterium]